MIDAERKTGRPEKARDEQRSERLPDIRVTLAERHHVETMAALAGLSLTEFSRRAILGQRITARREQQAAHGALVELNRVGVNLNQIARAVNRGRDLPPEFAEILAQIHAAILKLDGAGDGS